MCGKNPVKKELLLSLGMMVLMLMLDSTNTVASLCLADLDDDGKVHYSDLKIMNSEAGRKDCTVTPCQADLNDDGEVTNQDREILYTEFGRSNCLSPRDNAFEEKIDAVHLRQDERFEENGDGTVTDTKTGLMWTKDANIIGDTVLFHQARNYINRMNSGDFSNFGFTDWRLPTLRELQSLIEYAEFSSTGHGLPSEHPFQKVQSLEFYKSTSPTYLSNPDHSWFVDAYCRIVGHNLQSCFGFVWPVRGGE